MQSSLTSALFDAMSLRGVLTCHFSETKNLYSYFVVVLSALFVFVPLSNRVFPIVMDVVVCTVYIHVKCLIYHLDELLCVS